MSQGTNGIEAWILRVGRGFGVLIGALAALSVALGTLLLVLGLVWWPLGTPTAPTIPPAPPPPPAVTLADAEPHRSTDFNYDERSGRELAMRKERLLEVEALKAQFPEPDYAWDNVTEEYCRNPTSYGCLEQGRRQTRAGVGRFLIVNLDQVDEGERDFMRTELGRLLAGAPLATRANLVAPILVAELKRMKVERQQQQAWREAKSNLESEYSDAKTAHSVQWLAMVTGGASAIGSGIAAALGICMVVAALAIERHLRALALRSP